MNSDVRPAGQDALQLTNDDQEAHVRNIVIQRHPKLVAVAVATALGLQSTVLSGQGTPPQPHPRRVPPIRSMASILADVREASGTATVRLDDQLASEAPPS